MRSKMCRKSSSKRNFFARLESSQDRDDGEDDNDGDEEDGMTEVNIRLSSVANFHS